MPKGVLWRQHDIFMTSFGGRNIMTGEPSSSLDEIVTRLDGGTGTKLMILPPLIHGAAQWSVMTAITTGQTVVFPSVVDHLDADDVVRSIEREKVMAVTVVGDAVARPLPRHREEHRGCVVVSRGGQRRGAADPVHQATLDRGSAERDSHRRRRILGGRGADAPMSTSGIVSTGTFNAGPDTVVAAENRGSILQPGHDGMGWLAQRGYVPLGYKGDAVQTAATFPVINGVRSGTR